MFMSSLLDEGCWAWNQWNDVVLFARFVELPPVPFPVQAKETTPPPPFLSFVDSTSTVPGKSWLVTIHALFALHPISGKRGFLFGLGWCLFFCVGTRSHRVSQVSTLSSKSEWRDEPVILRTPAAFRTQWRNLTLLHTSGGRSNFTTLARTGVELVEVRFFVGPDESMPPFFYYRNASFLSVVCVAPGVPNVVFLISNFQFFMFQNCEMRTAVNTQAVLFSLLWWVVALEYSKQSN